MRRVPLRLKIAAFAANLVALAVGLLALFTVILPWRAKLASQDQLATALVQTVLPAAVSIRVDGTARVDPTRIHSMVANSNRTGIDIVYALFRDARGNLDPGACSVNEQVLRHISEPMARLYASDRDKALQILADGKPHPGIRVLRRIVVGQDKQPIGRLDIGLSTLSIDAELRRSLWRDAIVLAGTLLLAVLGAFFIAERIGRPLAELSQAMGKLQQGDFEVRSDAASKANDEVGDLATAFNEMAGALKERERLRGTLGRYVSSDVADRILEENSDLELRGEMRRVTVMFLDVRAFTAMAERLAPAEVVALLNEYFGIVVDRVQAHGGSINKFIGDAAMCIWGAPKSVETPERDAVECALEIQEMAAKLSARRAEKGLVTIAFGIGINAGEALAGNLGAARRLEYTVIGDAVNLAQRLESQARGGEVLVSQPVYEKVADRVETLGRAPVKLKGKAEPVPLWEVRRRKAAEAA